jgi:CheY-specific phosphatase CheX
LLFSGYRGYDEIVTAGTQEATTWIKSEAVMQLREDGLCCMKS